MQASGARLQAPKAGRQPTNGGTCADASAPSERGAAAGDASTVVAAGESTYQGKINDGGRGTSIIVRVQRQGQGAIACLQRAGNRRIALARSQRRRPPFGGLAEALLASHLACVSVSAGSGSTGYLYAPWAAARLSVDKPPPFRPQVRPMQAVSEPSQGGEGRSAVRQSGAPIRGRHTITWHARWQVCASPRRPANTNTESAHGHVPPCPL